MTEKLEILPSSPSEEIRWTYAVLQFDQPMDPNQYGSYYYGVKDLQGELRGVYATPTLHGKIQSTGGVKGTTIRLARVGMGQDTEWKAEYVDGPQREAHEIVTTPTPRPNGKATRPQTLHQSIERAEKQFAKVFKPYTKDQINTMLAVADERFKLWKALWSLVDDSDFPDMKDISVDQKARLVTHLALGAVHYADWEIEDVNALIYEDIDDDDIEEYYDDEGDEDDEPPFESIPILTDPSPADQFMLLMEKAGSKDVDKSFALMCSVLEVVDTDEHALEIMNALKIFPTMENKLRWPHFFGAIQKFVEMHNLGMMENDEIVSKIQSRYGLGE